MGLARGRGRGKGRGGIVKPKNRGPAVKPPPLLGRPAPPPPMALRPRGLPVPPLLPRMRPPPPHGLRPVRPVPHAPPPILGPGRPVPPPFHPRPPHPHVLPLPPPMPLRPPMPPPSLLRSRGPLPIHGAAYGAPLSLRGKFGGKRGGANFGKGGNRKGKGKKNESTEVSCSNDCNHYCETCDRSFRSTEALAEHLSQHQTCGLDGCQFTAHSAVVMRHVEMQHATGLYKKISAVSNNPEDIAKWIAERKKRYPTRENIEKQKKEYEEKMKRGERLEDDKSRFNRDFSLRRGRHHGPRGTVQGRGKRFVRRTSNDVCNKAAKIKHAPRKTQLQSSATASHLLDEEENKNYRGKLPAFLGTVAFSHEKEDTEDEEEEEKKFSDGEWDLNQENKTHTETSPMVSVSKALSNIMGMYASGASESEEDESVTGSKILNSQEVAKDSENTKTETKPSSSAQCSSNIKGTLSVPASSGAHDSDSSAPEEVPIVKSSNVTQPTDKQSECEIEHQASTHLTVRKRKRVHRHRGSKRKLEGKEENESSATKMQKPLQGPQRKNMSLRRRRLTLLEKLLSSEIRHERNVILQCVRYVVNENFFAIAEGVQKVISNEETTQEKQKILDRILNKISVLRQCTHYVVENNFFGVSCSEGSNCDEDNDN